MIKKIESLMSCFFIIIVFFIVSAILESLFAFTKYAGIISNFLALVILIYFFRDEIKNDIKIFAKIKIKKHLKYTLIFFLCYITVLLINSFLSLYIGNTSTNELLVESLILTNPLVYFFEVVFVAPFSEELICRLNFKKVFKNKWMFSLFTGLLFASFHLISATSTIEMLFIIPYFIMGFYLGYVYIDSQSIFTSILYHLLNNLIAFIILMIGSGL